jgi:hypothetical protein
MNRLIPIVGCALALSDLSAYAETNLSVPLDLDTAAYQHLVELRTGVASDRDALDATAQELEQLWNRLGSASTKAEKIEATAALIPKLKETRDQAAAFTERNSSIKAQAWRTLKRSGTEIALEIDPALERQFRSAGADLFELARPVLASDEAKNLSALASLRRMRSRLANNLIGAPGFSGDSLTGEQLVLVYESAESSVLIGNEFEGLANDMLAALEGWLIARQEGDLSGSAIFNSMPNLNNVVDAAVTAMDSTRGKDADDANTDYIPNPYIED